MSHEKNENGPERVRLGTPFPDSMIHDVWSSQSPYVELNEGKTEGLEIAN